jgi:nitrogen fixation NifU-like protein
MVGWLGEYSLMSPELIEHFRNPRNVGELPPPAITVEVSNPVCGDILRLAVLIDGGRITRCAYKVRGCTASIATGSALTELISGRDKTGLGTLTAADVEQGVGGLSNESKHAAALCLDAVRALLSQFPV